MALSAILRHLRTVDWIVIVYAATIMVIATTRSHPRPHALAVVAAHGLIIFLVILLQSERSGGLGRLLAPIYPLLLLPLLYASLDLLNQVGNTRVHDPLIQQWEAWIFGGQVSREWWRAMPSTTWSFILHAAYLGYYVIVPLPTVWFLVRGRSWEAERTLTLVTATFLFCYLVFLLFPVAGPYYQFERPADWFLDNRAARLVYSLLASGSSYGAAFPSSHVAATVASTGGALLGSRRLGGLLLLPTGLLVVGVVYTQMHYAVDALAGLGVGLIVVGLGSKRGGSRDSE